MRKQAGQALILVLIVLAIGAVLVVPSLRLTSTALMGTPTVERHTKGLYAADAATEYILWKLAYDDLGQDFTEDGQTANFSFNVCDVPVSATIVMRATEGEGGTTLATDDKIKPTKTVEHQYLPDPVPDKRLETYTYTIKLDHLSSDNSVGLDAIYDLPPEGINEYIGPTELRVDGGEWMTVPGPDTSQLGSKGYIKWPADYEWDPVVVNPFTSDGSDGFYGMRDFEVRQVKELRFQMRGRLGNNSVHCNWVVLKMEDGTNTLSGPQAPITVGNPDNPGECVDSSVVTVAKESEPEIIQPGIETDIKYTISITNNYTQTRFIEEITDYLPPGFEYLGPVSGITNEDPQVSLETIHGIERYQLRWTTAEFPGDSDITIASGETLTLILWAKATKDVSGSYYNEIIVILKGSGLPPGFGDVGVLPAEYGSNYSWNTGAVIVPAYDTSSDAEGITINSNMALILGGITITSWQVD